MLRARITAVVIAAALFAIGVSVTASYRGVRDLVADQFDRSLNDRADAVAVILDASRRPDPRPDTTEQLVLADGTVELLTAGRAPLPVPPGALDVARSGQGTREEDVTVDGTSYGLLTKARPGGGALMVGQAYADVERVDHEFLARITWTTAAATALSALLSWLILSRILGPVRRLVRAAEHITSTRDLTTALPPAGRDEVGRLTRAFEAMVGALRRSREQQQRLVQDASHELRTPLTSVRGCAELLQRARGRLDPKDEEQILGTLVTETVALDDLVRELVELATDAHTEEEPAAVDLAETAEESAQRHRQRTGRAITVTAAGPEPAPVLARPRAVQRCIDNLIGNAVKFSPDGSPIEVRIDGRRLAVRDRGPGIDPGERDAVFDRFYRGAGQQSAPGSGLGLAIVHDLVAADGGTVFAGTSAEGGAEVGFELPPCGVKPYGAKPYGAKVPRPSREGCSRGR
ncbi:ATP-binding protein [Kitasatospora sp. NPDC059722]|uniref:HAMP domain-containing sensor histidine kinase n=1 Tax=Kitasatospora sp. NPDC059722 TaxID=3346925 RepID=UPI0036742A1E